MSLRTISFLRAAVYVGLVATLAMPFVFTPSTLFPFVFGKGLVFSVIVEITAAFYLLLITVSPKDRPRRSPLLLAILGYGAALLVATFAGVDPHRSFWGNHERMSGFFIILHFIAFYLIARSVLKTKRHWHGMLGAFVLSSVVMGILAIVEHFSAKGLFLNAPQGRVWATLGNYIYLGTYMLFALFFTAYLFTEIRHRALRIALLLIGLFDFYVILLTESRAALLTLVLSGVVILFLAGWKARGRARSMVLVGAVLLALGIGSLFVFKNTNAVQSLPGVRRLVATTLSGGGDRTRLIAWGVALDAWKARPVFGWGIENYYVAFNLFYRPESLVYSYYETWFDRAHNTVLDSLAMTGTVGTLFYFGVFLVAIVTIVRRIRRGSLTPIQGSLFLMLLGAYFFQNLFAFDALTGFLLFYLLLAFLDSEPEAEPVTPEEREVVSASEKKGAMTALGIVALPTILIFLWPLSMNLRMWRANRENLLAVTRLREGKFAEGHALHNRAIARRSPYMTEIRADFAREVGQLTAQVPQERYPEFIPLLQTSVEDLRANVARGNDVFNSILLAQILMVSGQADLLAEAERVLVQAIPLSPKRQQLLFTLGRILILQGRSSEAIPLLEGVVRDEPRVGEAHWLLSLALYESKREEEAWKSLQEGLKNNYVWRVDGERQLAISLGRKFGIPEDPFVLLRYAEAEAELGDTDAARAHAEQAAAKDPALRDSVDSFLAELEKR